jgi:hypothetical protein
MHALFVFVPSALAGAAQLRAPGSGCAAVSSWQGLLSCELLEGAAQLRASDNSNRCYTVGTVQQRYAT